MLVVSKASRKSSIACCAKGANNAPFPQTLINYVYQMFRVCIV
jgi:hypothetical protein